MQNTRNTSFWEEGSPNEQYYKIQALGRREVLMHNTRKYKLWGGGKP